MEVKTLMTSCLELMSASLYGIFITMYAHSLLISILLLSTKFWPILPILLFWSWYDRETPSQGGRRLKYVDEFPLYKYLQGYFSACVVKTGELNPDKNYIFAMHPHGVICVSLYVNFLSHYSKAKEVFSKHNFFAAALDANFYIPLLKDWGSSMGFVSSSKRSLKYLLNDKNKGNVVGLAIGGSDEVAYTKPGANNLVLNKRKGFIKVALTEGCGIVPVYNFGENDVYSIKCPSPGTILYKIQQLLKTITGLNLGIPKGRCGLLTIVPRRVQLVTVFGEPIDLPKIPEPTQQQIDYYHSLYVEQLIKLFNEHKQNYCPEDSELIIVE